MKPIFNPRATRIGTCVLASLVLALPVLTVWGASATASATTNPLPESTLLAETFSVLREPSVDIDDFDFDPDFDPDTEAVTLPEAEEPAEESVLEETQPTEDLYDPSLPVTQELIARRVEASMSDADREARGGTTIRYPYPAGAMAVELYKDGSRILKGQVADIGGTVYVPVQRFADLFGSFKTVYTQATEEVVITGKNLSVTVRAGDPYITVNERIF